MPLDMSLTAGTRVSYRVMPVASLGRSFRLWRAIRGILAEEPEFIAVAAADTAQTVDTVRAIQTPPLPPCGPTPRPQKSRRCGRRASR